MSQPKPFLHPQAHSPLEIYVMRALFALVLVDVIPRSVPPFELSMPVGLAGMGLDLTFLANNTIMGALAWISYAMLIPYVLGRLQWLTTTWLFAVTVLVGTYFNSNGSLKHHHQVVSLILLAQAVWHIWFAVRHRKHPGDTLGRDRWMMFCSQQAILAAYVVTGITKVNVSGFFGWIHAADNYPIQLRKTNLQAYYSTLEAKTDAGGAMERLFTDTPALARTMLGAGLILELLAFLGLFGRKWSFVYGLLLIGFHAMNSTFMNLNFRWHNECLAIFLVLPPVIAWFEHWSRGRTKTAQHQIEHPPHAHPHAPAKHV